MAMNLPRQTFWHEGKKVQRIPAEFYESWTMALDIGQSADYTAVSVIRYTRTPRPDYQHNERAGTLKQKIDELFDVVGLQRLPLGMPYPQQVDRVQQLLADPKLRGHCDLVIDQTGC